MKITIEIEYADIQKIKQFYDNHKDNKFVQVRYNRNVLRKELDFSWEFLWKSIIMCLLTTQQRSGPTSPVSKFIPRMTRFTVNQMHLAICLSTISEVYQPHLPVRAMMK